MKMFIFFLAITFVIVTWVIPVRTAMTSTNFEIFADSVSVLDVGPVTTTNYTLYSTVGEVGVTTTQGSTVELRAGFQAMELGGLGVLITPSSIDFGTLSTTAVSTSSVSVNVTTDSGTGYTVTATEDGNLRSGSNTIDDVTDGSVTAGSEEYGIRTSGVSGQLANDTAIAGTVTVASTSTAVTADTTSVIFSAAASANTTAGTYSNQVTLTVTVNP